jgi:hypothetical protein
MSPIAKIALLRLALGEFNRMGSHRAWMRLQPVTEAVEWLWTRTEQTPPDDVYEPGFWFPMADDGELYGFSLEHLAFACEETEAAVLAPNFHVVFGKTASGERVWSLQFSKGDDYYMHDLVEAWVRCLNELLAKWIFLPPASDDRAFDPSLVKDRSEDLRAAQALLLQRFPDGVAGLRLPSAEQTQVQALTASETEALWAFV